MKFDSNVTVSEPQMKLAIAQTLSLPFAYNSPVRVLDFDAGDSNSEKITGRFKDLSRPRVFSFEITRKSVVYKPFVARHFVARTDGTDFDIESWEDFSKGYAYRLDNQSSRKEKAQCVKPTSYNCGSICINIKKNCKANVDDSFSEERIDKLFKLKKLYLDELYNSDPSQEKEADLLKKNTEISLILKPYNNRIKELEIQKQERIKEQRSRQIEILKTESQAKRSQLAILADELKSNSKIPKDISLKILNKIGEKEFNMYVTESLEITTEAKKEIDIILDKSRELIKADNPVDLSVSFDPKNTRNPDEYKDGLEMFSKMISVPNLTETLGVKETDSGRSYHRQGAIHMGNADPGTIIHESGHWLEARSIEVRREVQEFYDKRTEGESTVKMSQATNNPFYNDSEVTKVDKWIHPYMGKVYDGASEVLSMGLELMYRNPIYLAKNDPEMFDFIYSVVRQGN